MTITLISFGYKYGPIPQCPIVDCTTFPNPHWDASLRALDGRDERVKDFLRKRSYVAGSKRAGVIDGFVNEKADIAELHKQLAFGCIGGKHRSVAIVEMVAEVLKRRGQEVKIVHSRLAPV